MATQSMGWFIKAFVSTLGIAVTTTNQAVKHVFRLRQMVKWNVMSEAIG